MSDNSARAAHTASYFPAVDTLRCFAVTAVILQHSRLLPLGWTGVWLFFVISGFVVTHALISRDEPGKSGGFGFLNFMLRRTFRIWPILYAYAGVSILAALVAGAGLVWQAPLAAVTFTSNFYMMADGEGISPFSLSHVWTLAVEEQFYIVFGLLFSFAPRRIFIGVLMSMIVLAPLIRAGLSYWLAQAEDTPGHAAFIIYAASPAHFDAFAAGGLIAIFRERIISSQRLLIGLSLAALAALAVYVGTYVAVNAEAGRTGADLFRDVVSGVLYGHGREIFLYTAIWLASAALLCWTLAAPPIWGRIVALKPLQWVGRISYGAYLYQMIFLFVGRLIVGPFPADATMAQTLAHGLKLFLVAYPLTLAFSYLSHRYFEKPIIAFGQRWERQRVARRAASRAKSEAAQPA
jgi:peptidoglycan/LPS O-acetylase OafA/YrhL